MCQPLPQRLILRVLIACQVAAAARGVCQNAAALALGHPAEAAAAVLELDRAAAVELWPVAGAGVGSLCLPQPAQEICLRCQLRRSTAVADSAPLPTLCVAAAVERTVRSAP